MDELIEFFEIPQIHRAPAAFNLEKLLWLNQHYIKTGNPEYIATELAWHMKKIGLDVTQGPPLTELLSVQVDRAKTLLEMAEKSRFFYADVEYDATARSQHLTQEVIPALTAMKVGLENITDWRKEAIHHVIVSVSEALQVKLGKIAQPVRVAVTGNTMSPALDVTLALLGRERTLARLDAGLALCQKKVEPIEKS
jgi:glutamyl-tRNA synthetase